MNNKIKERYFFIINIFIKIRNTFLVIFCYFFISTITIYAHEFWIEPIKYINEEDNIIAHLKVGQNFRGMALMYNNSDFTKFNILTGVKNKKDKIKGSLGDVPAINQKSSHDNLLIIYHETTDKFINYKKFSKFKDFVLEKSNKDILKKHTELGYPEEKFVESYRRYAKSLIAINGTSGQDKNTGLLFEFVLNNNPYELENHIISAFLYYKKKPLINHKVTVFSKKNNKNIDIKKLVTDEKGLIEFQVEEGREYLLDSVIILPKKGNHKKNEPIWHSIWASTTFAIP